MDSILSGGVAELEAAKAALIDRNEKEEASHQAAMAKRSKEKDLASQVKYVDEKVKSTIKSNRNSLVKAYEDQISGIEKEKKAIGKARRIAKEEAVDSKIRNETADLEQETERMKTELKSVFKRFSVPSFCKTRLYYALFYPQKAADFLVFALTAIIAVAVIPNIICHFVKFESVWIKVLVYAAIVLFFVIIYFLVLLLTKGGKKGKAVLQARPVTEKIRDNEKSLRKMRREIRSDSDESEYGLDEFDEKLNQLNNDISEKENAMSEALKDFDENTAPSIERDIRQENQEEIDALSKDLEDLTADSEKKAADAAAANDELSTKYEAFLGQKNMSVEKLDAMITAINEGGAETVLQAMNQISGEIRQ